MLKNQLIKLFTLSMFSAIVFLVFYYVYGYFPHSVDEKKYISTFIYLVFVLFFYFPLLVIFLTEEVVNKQIHFLLLLVFSFVVIIPFMFFFYINGHFPQIGGEREEFVLQSLFFLFLSFVGSLLYGVGEL